MNKEKTLKLNTSLAGQTRNWLFGFGATMAAMLLFGSVVDGADKVKDTKEVNQLVYGNSKLLPEDKKDLAKDLSKNAVLVVIAFATIYAMVNGLRASKRENDDAIIRIARRYMMQMRKTNPELKKYDYILNNDMALYNIAAGVANMVPTEYSFSMGSYSDITRYRSENISGKNIAGLKAKNKAMESIISDLKEYTDRDPRFMDKLTTLVESSAKTFAFEKYMSNQKTR